MRRTALYNSHRELGGRMVDFAGWELPVQYPTGPTREHNAVRTAAGLFDIDHMGQFEVKGRDAEPFLQRVQVADVHALRPMEGCYSLVTYADGTIVDDVFVYRLGDRWLIVVNAANRGKDFQWLTSHVDGFHIELADISDATYMLALQGPASHSILQTLSIADLADLAPRYAAETVVDGIPTLVSRTGYTGEDGFELYFPAEAAEHMWNSLLDGGAESGLLPCGLAARDTLRFEAGMPLYGHEIDGTTNPIEARLGWTVHYQQDFIGRDAVLKAKLEGPARRLVGIEMADKAVARAGYPILADGVEAGHVTSGMKSPTLDRFLGMAYVSTRLSHVGEDLEVIVRGQPKQAVVIARPFYRRLSR